MSKASELIENIDRKYKAELQRIEEQLASDIKTTSTTITDSLNARVNTTESAILDANKKVSQTIQESTEQINEQVKAYQTSLESLMSRTKTLNDQQTEKRLSILNLGLISIAIILIIGILAMTWICKNKYQEMQNLNSSLIEKQETIEHLNTAGAKIKFATCGSNKRTCIMVNPKAGTFGDNGSYMIPMGY